MNINLTGEVLIDLGGIKEVQFDDEALEEYFVFLNKKNSIDLGPWGVYSQNARLDDKNKKYLVSKVKIKKANEVESYVGTDILK